MAEFESLKPNIGNDLPPIISNNIRIEGILGRGGMGTVYRAKHLSLDRDVAVKIINPEFAAETKLLLENSIAAQTSPMFKFLTQTSNVVDDTKLTKNLQNVTDPLLIRPLAEIPVETQVTTVLENVSAPQKQSGSLFKVVGGIAATLILIAGGQ